MYPNFDNVTNLTYTKCKVTEQTILQQQQAFKQALGFKDS